MSRGGIDLLSKGGIDLLSKGGETSDGLGKLRRQHIQKTEQYYFDLQLSQETGWGEFVRHCWSRWLVENAEKKVKQDPDMDSSDVLDRQYSAQQCVLNLLSLCRQLQKRSENGGTQSGGGETELPARST